MFFASTFFFLLSFVFLEALKTFSHSPVLIACSAFSLLVHHSRFSTLLSVLIPFIWFTCGLFSGLGINALATSLCGLKLYFFLLTVTLTTKYPFGFGCAFKYLLVSLFHTSPVLVMKYGYINSFL